MANVDCSCFEELDRKEGILNDNFYIDEVGMDSSLIRFSGNTCFVLVSNKTDKRIFLRPGEVFCEGVILDHREGFNL